ncbi:hypothetical protein LCGC14_2906930, partial [marine sediment metagenome]
LGWSRGNCEKHESKEHGDVYGFSRREPRAGKLACGVPKRGRGWRHPLLI